MTPKWRTLTWRQLVQLTGDYHLPWSGREALQTKLIWSTALDPGATSNKRVALSIFAPCFKAFYFWHL